MKRKFLSAVIAISLLSSGVVFADNNDTYTFSGVNIITDGSTDEITDKKLTDDISVTTSGAMNRKYAAITDLEHNKDVGTYPISENFKADGSYIYLGAATVNDGNIITLNIPKIDAGSRVTITFAKPTITNNGSALRNTNDPYAYFKIGDRYISINGDNFDTWRTEDVVLGEDTDTIEFHCDKWGAVAISKIEVSDGNGEKLYDLNIHSNQYAKLNINGIKFNADENGVLTVPSFPTGETINISAEKDGYKPLSEELTISDEDVSTDLYLECETNSIYYESDFGNSSGTLSIDGTFNIKTDVKEVTSVSGNITFSENGNLIIKDSSGKDVFNLRYDNGIYANGKYITPKNNMDFTAVFDKAINKVTVTQNGESHIIDCDLSDFKNIDSISGNGAVLEYISVSYPDMNNISISGPETVTVSEMYDKKVQYQIVPEYLRPDTDFNFSVYGIDGVSIDQNQCVTFKSGTEGTAVIKVQYNNTTVEKEVKVISSPVIKEWSVVGNTINLGSSKQFKIEDCKDEYGGDVSPVLKDFSSSDENIITVNDDGVMTAVGTGTATITANAYTGTDNVITALYNVERFYINGVTESEVSYAKADIIENENIESYKISYADGTEDQIEISEVPAATADNNGKIITAMYDADGKLNSVLCENASKGDKLPVSNGNKHIYFKTETSFSEITQSDTVMHGYEINHTAGVPYEISPIYKFNNIGDVKDDGKTLDGIFSDGYYDITFKKGETWRGDIFVNGFMVGNNVDQSDADRKLVDGALYTAEDIKIKDGSINVSMCDGSTQLDYVTVEKHPEFYSRPQRIYVIGDSLACEYYGEFENEVGGGRSGWGQQLDDFVTVPVTNLANSGQYAAGLYKTAFPSIPENGEKGDILLIECGYNDRNYSTKDEMISCVKDMIKQCRDKGIIPILVTPNASQHDYKPSVVWSSYLRDIAVDTNCQLIDLSNESYEFLYSLYGEDKEQNITKNFNLTEVGGDNLHSSYAGAYKWAETVAQGLKDLGYDDIINSEFKYDFTDTLGNKIICQIK